MDADMKFDSMVVYRTWMDAIEDLDDADAGKVIKAFMRYGMDREEPEDLPPVLNAIFKMAKGNIDSSNRKKENGSKGGKASSKPQDDVSKPQANNKQTTSKSKQTVSKSKQTASNVNVDVDVDVDVDVNKNPIARERTPSDARFEIFWQTYPKKVGKKEAEKAFMDANISADLFDRIIKAIGEAKESEQWTKDGGQYIPNAANWLSQGRWDDQLPRRKSRANFKQRDRTDSDFESIELQLLQKRRDA